MQPAKNCLSKLKLQRKFFVIIVYLLSTYGSPFPLLNKNKTRSLRLFISQFRLFRNCSLQSFAVASGAVYKPGGDTAGQDALHSASVEGSEDAGAHSKLPQPSQEEEALMCLLQHCICVSRPCEILSDVNAEELKAVYPTVVSSENLTMTLELCVAVQSCVYREYRSWLRTQP